MILPANTMMLTWLILLVSHPCSHNFSCLTPAKGAFLSGQSSQLSGAQSTAPHTPLLGRPKYPDLPIACRHLLLECIMMAPVHADPMCPVEGHFLQEQARAVKEAAVYVSMLRRLGKGHGKLCPFLTLPALLLPSFESQNVQAFTTCSPNLKFI